MRMYDLIEKKKNGGELSKEEIQFLIQGYTKGEIPDYQMAAFLMAVYFQKMTVRETAAFTFAMADSGDRLNLERIHGIKVDKHSTGGVGDKTSLIIGPMLATLGVPVVKMSGRGLGHTGGTIDKLESFTGFSSALSEEDFIRQVNTIHFALAGQTANLAPADKKIYALRDVTDTVNQKSLIASSIMSKKLASGADVLVLDVKTGSGAFMQTEQEAVSLAQLMVAIGESAGKKTIAVISDMNEPLGQNVGNALEVQEAISVLEGNGEERLRELSLTLAAYMLMGAQKADNLQEARKMLEETIASKAALDKMAEFVKWQGGDADQVYHKETLLHARYEWPLSVSEGGYIQSCNAKEVGEATMLLGGGRTTKDSSIDLHVGFHLKKKIGDQVEAGETIAVMYGDDEYKMEEAKKRFLRAYKIGDHKPPERKLIKQIITIADIPQEMQCRFSWE